MRKVVILGLAALAAGIVFAFVTLFVNHPARSTALEAPTPVASEANLASASILLAPTATATPAATATPIPPTATPVPPTPTATAAPPVKTGSAPPPNVTSESIAVIDGGSGALLYGKDPHKELAPASLTKIFTALVALKYGHLHQTYTVHFDQSQLVDSTLMGLHEGDRFTLEDLLYGLLLPSGNDAALAIANIVGGNETNFVQMMNQEAADLGLHDSHFMNPHGLDAKGHYSSAYDLAMASRYGMQHYPEFRKIVATKVYTVHGSRTFTIYNLNRLLQHYPGADGVKIGYTDNAGHTVVGSATRNGHRVFVALMNCGDTLNDTVPLLNWAFDNFTWPANAPLAAGVTPTPTPTPKQP